MTEIIQPIPARLKNIAVGGHVAGADQIIDDQKNKTQETINSEVDTALENKANKSAMTVTPGTGANADKTTIQLKSGTSATVLTQHQDISGKADNTSLQAEVTRATNAENALDGRIDTLEDAVGTGGSVDSRISDAVATETTRAQGVESNLSSGKADKATTLAGYGITDAYTKSETYTKTEVNGLVDTPHQEYVTVDAYASLPATGSKDTIYRVSNYNGSTSQVDASVYSEYAWNGSQYVFLCVKSQVGEVFDISVYNNNAKYADLTAALNGGANIPQSLQKGGMTIRFIQSSDNKYIQARCMAQNFTTDVTQWQGVDDEPTAGSNNLVKSGGVYGVTLGKYSTQFSISAGSGHSSRYDQIIVNIPAGNKFQIIGEEISGTWSVNLYITAYYTDGTYEELPGYITKASNSRIYIGSKNIAAVGFYANTSTTAYEVKCILYHYTEKETLIIERIEDTEDSISIEQKLSSINSRMQVYPISSNGILIEETNRTNGSIYIGNTNIAIRVYKTVTYSPATFAEELGVSLVTSPSGMINSIEIANINCLVYDCLTDKFTIKERNNIAKTDILFINCVDGQAMYLNEKFGTNYSFIQYRKLKELENHDTAENKLQIYPDNNPQDVIIEEGYVNSSNSIYLHNMSYMFRAYINKTYGNNTALAADLGVSLVTSPSGAQNCIEIANTKCLVLDLNINLPAIKSRDSISYSDIVIVSCVSGQIRELRTSYLLPILTQLSGRVNVLEEDYDITNINSKADEFSLLFKGTTGDVEPFIFFSDPHFYQDYNNATPVARMNSFLHTVKRIFDETPTNFVISGGDWLSAHKQNIAVKALGQIDGITKGLFGDKYYPVFGNHDNNYQGELDETEGTSANDGALTNQQMINLWFRRWNKMYYTFKGSSSLFYVFDTGIDSSPMTDYRWEQVNWFGQSLLSNNELHNIVVMHIVSESGQEFANITPMAQAIADIANAFNQRTSVTVNGVTYNYTNATGKVHCILCGHTHYDYTTTLSNIPVFCITTTMAGNSFDLILLDYAAGKLKSIRCGTSGSNREINIA